MGKKGWWKQLQTDDIPSTQKNYGDARAADARPQNKSMSSHQVPDQKIEIQKECPRCGQLYWVDKRRCYNCGWPQGVISAGQRSGAPIHQGQEVTVLCPKCGSRMVLRTARKGPNANRKFWGCSRYPECWGASSYRG